MVILLANMIKKVLTFKVNMDIGNFKSNINKMKQEFKGFTTVGNEAKKKIGSLEIEASLLKKALTNGKISTEGYTRNMTRLTRSMEYLKTQTDNTTRKMDMFHGELLSMMFAGMALSSVMQGLLNPAMQAYGMMEIWNSALTVFFLPLMDLLMPFLLSFTDWFMNMPESVQLGVGAITVILLVIGKLITILGTVGLALFGFIEFFEKFPTAYKLINNLFFKPFKLMFSSIGTIIKGAITFITGLSAPVLVTIAVIIAALIALYVAWKYNFGNIREHFEEFKAAIKKIIDGIVNFFKNLIDLIVGIFTGDKDKIKNAAQGIKDSLDEIWQGIKDAVSSVKNWIIDSFEEALEWVDNLIEKISGISISDSLKAVSDLFHEWHIPGFANGGIITTPTLAMVGEAGPEAVIPLSKLGNMGNTTINVSVGNVRSDADIDRIANIIDQKLQRNKRRYG